MLKGQNYNITMQISTWNVGVQDKAIVPLDRIQPYFITNLSILVPWHSALWHQSPPNLKAGKVCKQGLVQDEDHLLFTWSTYGAICESCDDIKLG